MNTIRKTRRIIRLVCLVIISIVTFHAKAQEKPPTFIYKGEEYEALPHDESGSPTWWEATERCSYKQAYGHSDWFIPDIDQLRALYAHQNAIGGFTDNWYWSSTRDNKYSSVVLNFKNCQSYPERNDSRAAKCRYVRKTGRTQGRQADYQWIYGEWTGKYQYYHHVWKEAYMVVTITPKKIVISDKGAQIYEGGYVIKDNLIEYIPYHNDYGWIGSDVWGFIELMPDSHQLGSGYKKVLNKTKNYNYSTRPQQVDQQKNDKRDLVSKPKDGEDNNTEIKEENVFDGQEVFPNVEEMPAFLGGEEKLWEYISQNIQYPQTAREKGIQGRVFVGFIVEPDGSISNVKMLRGIGGGCDEEAMRVIKSMPKWKPGKQGGKPVRVSYQIPISFFK